MSEDSLNRNEVEDLLRSMDADAKKKVGAAPEEAAPETATAAGTKAAEIRPECDSMLKQVQSYVEANPDVCDAL